MDEELQVLPSTDARMVRVRRRDGAEFDLPRDAAVTMGLVPLAPVRQSPVVQAPPAATPAAPAAPPAAPQQPAEPSVDDFIAGLASGPAAPPAPPAAPPIPELGLQGADAQAAAALLTPQGQAQAGVAPPAAAHQVGPGVPSQVLQSPYRPMGEVIPAPSNAARPGETFAPVSLPQQPAAAPPADAPRPGMRRRAAPAQPAQPPDLIDQLTQRPMDAAPLAPQDFREMSPLEQQQQLIAEGERLAREGAAGEARAAMERADILEAAQAEQRALQAEREAAMARATQRYEAAVEEARNARVDPTRFFSDRGAAGTIGVAIATALGGLGAALSGGPNQALDTINRAIDRDIAAQEANQRNAQAGVGNARTFLDIARQQFDDRAAAQQAARSLAWGQVAERAGAQAATLRDQGARLRAQELQQQAEAQAAQARAAAEQAQFDAEMSRRRTIAEVTTAEAGAMRAMRRAQGGGGAGRTPTAATMDVYNRLVDSGVAPADAARQLRIQAPPSGRFAQAGAAAEQRFDPAIAATEEALRGVRELVPAEGDLPGFGPVASRVPELAQSDAARQLRQRVTNLVNLYGRLQSGAAISAEEEALFARIIGAHENARPEDLRRGLDLVERELAARRGRASQPSPAQQQAAPPLPAGVRPR
jgi:hypothetical protein